MTTETTFAIFDVVDCLDNEETIAGAGLVKELPKDLAMLARRALK